jgi:hypothetical protein
MKSKINASSDNIIVVTYFEYEPELFAGDKITYPCDFLEAWLLHFQRV